MLEDGIHSRNLLISIAHPQSNGISLSKLQQIHNDSLR